jgi:hypothetical protein
MEFIFELLVIITKTIFNICTLSVGLFLRTNFGERYLNLVRIIATGFVYFWFIKNVNGSIIYPDKIPQYF